MGAIGMTQQIIMILSVMCAPDHDDISHCQIMILPAHGSIDQVESLMIFIARFAIHAAYSLKEC